MPFNIKNSLDVFSGFISVAHEVAALPVLVLPQYQNAARDLYEISSKLLTANENISRWLHKFLYFDFQDPNARGKFLTLVQEYKTMKIGPEYQQLKFSCHDIGQIYYREISSKLGLWFSNQTKLEEAEGVFSRLTDADNGMVEFTYDHIIGVLDRFVGEAEKYVDAGDFDSSEEARLNFKVATREVIERLENFSGDLASLTIQFAGAARVPITLRRA